MNKSKQHRRWILGIHRGVFVALALAIMLVLAVLATGSVQAQTYTYSVLYSFGQSPDGAQPIAGLVQDAQGNLYGTTTQGGANDNGTVFKLDTSGKETVLYSFPGTGGDGMVPYAGLVQDAQGNLYGTTAWGGANNYGTVFKLDTSGNETVLYSFTGTGGDGVQPLYGGLVQDAQGNLYGTTSQGGDRSCNAPWGCGTVFKLDTSGKETVLYSFTRTPEGKYPNGGLVQDAQGNLYGTTSGGGDSGWGTVFKLDTSGNETVLHSFTGGDGNGPYAGLVQDAQGNLYGTTAWGGANNYGTVFKLDTSGNETVLYSFTTTGGDGAQPLAGLVQDAQGNLYGTTQRGGDGSCDAPYGCGTVFKLDTSGKETVLHSFTGTGGDGAQPMAGLVQDAQGNLYGTTAWGGANNYGTVFKLTQNGAAVKFSPTALSFGNVVINTTSNPKTVTVTNSGSAPLNITGIGLGPASFNFYSVTCGGTLAVGAKCKIGVIFTPTGLGKVTGTIELFDNAPNSPQTVPLTGTGVLPATLTPASATYAKQAVGTTSLPKTFTLTNNQTVTLTGITISTTGDFAVSATTCTTSLAAKGKCTISLTFTPSTTGTRTGTLSASDSANNSPQTAALSGTGVVPATLTPATATYVAQAVGTTSAAKTFTLTNNQIVALTGITISTTGDFAVSATTCTASLGAKGKCTISVTFTPTQIGTRTGQLSVSDSASNSPQTSNLKGTGK